MNGFDEYNRRGHPSSGDADVGEMRAKAECLMKVGMLLDTGQLDKAEAAKRLGLLSSELDEILDGHVSDLTVAKIVGRSRVSGPAAEDQAF
ncbi:putative XRE-type DNA-binding protein [Pseudomonas sp. JAI111]|jgi:predicted XRE-type DNA-binding protein|uniref:helix-turn-helix domain-containing protein n=1 Tax=Pseudomonas sp. JAI111 TaxID=2735913 RepID=UPI002168036F|nr:helix-turn-helix domain-containing protein [Pseudomonas sp. JAI111]MCS3837336.1 putative XRE-type DNA-binding protein [Pseudomonas sp. JAI111]